MRSYQVAEVVSRMASDKKANQRLTSKLLTISQVADLLNVHTNTVRHWSDSGLIKAYRIGVRRDRRFKPEEIDKFINISQL